MRNRNKWAVSLVAAVFCGLAGCSDGDTSQEANGNAAATALGDVGVRAANADNAGGAEPVGCQDQDGDGFGENCEKGPDCDDSRRSANSEQLEQCGDGFDNDCDGRIEEGCGCNEGESLPCYPGADGTQNIGRCRAGFQVCRDGILGPCEASRIPIVEICNGADDDCDGNADEELLNACGKCGDLPDEECNGADDDCDGRVDETVTNRCGGCGEEPKEYCDGLDNDCDGTMDEDCECLSNVKESCYEGRAGTAGIGVCRKGFTSCRNGVRTQCLNQVVDRGEECNGLDDDCDGKTDEGVKNACGTCGRDNVPQEDCVVRGAGGRTTGNGLDDDCDGKVDEGCQCDERTRQPCYTGKPITAGKGICIGGFASCINGVVNIQEPSDCEGQVLPKVNEAGTPVDECGNDTDDDCDGKLNEGCPPADCVVAEETCNELDDDCDGQIDEQVRGPCGCIVPGAEEVCGNGLDDDCDGRMEEVCGCAKGPPVECYGGPPETIGVGVCRRGVLQCVPGSRIQQSEYSRCVGWVGPSVELCRNGKDDDCDGMEDEGAADANACGTCGPLPVEVCDGTDNDCDGAVDEGVSNRCGTCGDEPAEVCDGGDNDCDGLIDEGTVNHCGLCGLSCVSVVYDDPDDWASGIPVNLTALPEKPNGLGLGDREAKGDSYLWVARHTRGEVVQINTRTCRVEGVHSSWGMSPSRTAVAADGSVWVGNRGWGGDASDYQIGNAVHLNVDGTLICRARVTGTRGVAVRALALDQEGNAWIGSWDRGKMYRVSGTEVELGDAIDDVPDCKILQEVDIDTQAYGAAIDSKGFLWVAQNPTKVDTRDGAIVGKVPKNNVIFTDENGVESRGSVGTYGIAIDRRDNVWYGTTSPNGYLARLDGKTHEMRAFYHGGNRTRGVAVDLDGNIWGAGGDLYKMSPEGEHLLTAPSSGAFGVAVDAQGKIWAVSGSTATRYNTDGTPDDCQISRVPLANGGTESLGPLYTYSDMTGMQLLTITLRAGRWSVRINGQHPDVIWDRVDWSGVFPPGTLADVRVRTAPSPDRLSAAAWSGRSAESPYVIPPINIQSGFTPANQWLELEIRLTREGQDAKPILERVEVFYQRP